MQKKDGDKKREKQGEKEGAKVKTKEILFKGRVQIYSFSHHQFRCYQWRSYDTIYRSSNYKSLGAWSSDYER